MAWQDQEIRAHIRDIRNRAGEGLVGSRAASEQEARVMLNSLAGQMSDEQALKLGRLFNTGMWNGTVKYSRFSPAFHGATMKKMVSDIDLFNYWTKQLWSPDEKEALSALDQISKDASSLPGAGRSYPSVLLYLRDPKRFSVWMKSTVQGFKALTGDPSDFSRARGSEGFGDFCLALAEFEESYGLAPQESDAILAGAYKAERQKSRDDKAKKVRPKPAGEIPTIESLHESTSISVDDLETWVELLRGSKKQALFYGPPGTGKTFIAERLAHFLAGSKDRVRTVQFHPSYSYEDFIEGLRPDATANTIRYVVRPGSFSDFCAKAAADLNNNYVFVIDEINRADLGSVLGELMLLLEYRGKEVELPYSKKLFSVPPNIVLLASMNTADRSLALVDFALRRRFHTIQVLPNRTVLEDQLEGQEGAELALKMFDLVQRAVASEDFAPGHSYWLTDDISALGLLRLWDYELRPYLAEFWFEHPTRLEELAKEISGLLADEA